MRPRSSRLPAAGLLAFSALLAAATGVLAGGWAQVTAQSVPADPPAGEETSISLEVLQHGVTPVNWPKLTVIATDKATGKVVAAQAVATGTEGSYVVKIAFPAAGDWALSYSSPDLMMEGTAAVNVSAPIAAAAVTTPATEATSAFDAMPVIAVLSILVVLVVAWLSMRGHRPQPGTRVSAGT